MKKALILVDIQNDFVPGGALPVPNGADVVEVANKAMEHFDLVVAIQDWHPAGHKSFASQHKGRKVGDIVDLCGLQQMLWPDHCVQDSKGAEFVPGLEVKKIDKVFHKGMDRNIDSYSGFFDNGHGNATGLGDYLKENGVDEITIIGLATDYCVKFTALDARKLGFKTRIIIEGVRGVEVNKGDCEKAIDEMIKAGVEIISMKSLK
ncbi:MAG TPA: bifunctional nicotinamidase/pyrazinamidase [Lentisphaeria bacterium]|nr:MAG: nicotinamidase [Lentisphaerae bacterium GWF2_50_93]HCE44771.1 bifunctional nicotinamidase/pyrazinamidase [Lentisphaeria bacterium]